MKEKRPLQTLSNFLEEEVARMVKEPPYITETAYHIFSYKGVEVQLVFQREKFSKIGGNGLFTKGDLK